MTLHRGLPCSTRTPSGTREPQRNPPCALCPPANGGAARCFCCAPGGARKRGCKRRCEGQGGIPALHPVARRAFRRRPKASAKTAMWYSDACVTAMRPPCADRPPPPGGGAENAALRAASNPFPPPLSYAMFSAFLVNSQRIRNGNHRFCCPFLPFRFFPTRATNSQRFRNSRFRVRFRNSRFRVRCFRCCSFRRMFLDIFG